MPPIKKLRFSSGILKLRQTEPIGFTNFDMSLRGSVKGCPNGVVVYQARVQVVLATIKTISAAIEIFENNPRILWRLIKAKEIFIEYTDETRSITGIEK
jgi:hypothetical protein